jgi:CelD/BcsL family acetyltransferase involved in cellulose biosynthesis
MASGSPPETSPARLGATEVHPGRPAILVRGGARGSGLRRDRRADVGVSWPLGSAWDRLAEACDAAPWLRRAWAQAWWSSFGRGTPTILGVEEAGRLVAVAPFARRFGVLAANVNYHSPGFDLLAVDAAAHRRLAEGLFEGRPRRVSIRFFDGPPERLSVYGEVAEAHGYRWSSRVLARSPYIATGDDRRPVEARLSKHFAAGLRRRRRRLEELGTVAFEVHDGRERLDALLSEGLAVEVASWKGDRGSAVVSRPDTLAFYTAISRWAATSGWLRLAFLRVDGRAIAFDLAIEWAGRYYGIKHGYDATFARYSPGNLLVLLEATRALELGLSTVEMLGSDEPYKLEWTSETRERVSFEAFASSPAGRLDRALHTHAMPLAKAGLVAARAVLTRGREGTTDRR